MTKKRILIASLAAISLAAITSGVVMAEENHEGIDDMASLATVHVTLQQAIATAEQKSPGRAISAEIRQNKGAARIEVEVMGAQGTQLVLVDAQSGQVTAIRADEQD